MKKLKLILVGGGDRGNCYLKYLQTNADKFELVALVEPVKEKREHFVELYGVSEDMCFDDYKEVLNRPKFADIVMICTQDKMHFEPAMMSIDRGYDLLLEKPVSPDAKECIEISKKAKEKGVRVLVCHVLRYTPFYKTMKKIIEDGKIGEITNINHIEGVGNVHISHSFVRGNWRKTQESAPMILAKCCHDTDLLQWLMGEECTQVQSFGTRGYFCEENAPEGAPQRCLDGCPHKDTCFYYAPTLYKGTTAEVQHFRAIVANKFDPTDEEVEEILQTSPYGRCVFHCDNDVVDRQIVNMVFGKNKMATLTMSGFNKGGRITTIMGTKGEMRADMEKQTIEVYEFETGKTVSMYDPKAGFDQTIAGGHGGGDAGIMEDLYEYIANNNPSNSISDISVSCMSHLICFAAEDSRLENKIINMKEYKTKF